MTYPQLLATMQAKQSLLCVGLDLDPDKLPAQWPRTIEGYSSYLEGIIKATAPFAVAYKINTAFMEALGTEGWQLLAEVRKMLPPDSWAIADAKRGDIGNTVAKYAQAFLGELNFDALTVSPYMGLDTLQPYLAYEGKTIIALALTSNPGATDFQLLKVGRTPLYQVVANALGQQFSPAQLALVAGATRPAQLAKLRRALPNHMFLVPGIGAQGGSLSAVCRAGFTPQGPLLINVGRDIIYPPEGQDTFRYAARKAKSYQRSTARYLSLQA